MRANVLLQNVDGQSIDVSSPFLTPSLQFAFVGRDVGLLLGVGLFGGIVDGLLDDVAAVGAFVVWVGRELG